MDPIATNGGSSEVASTLRLDEIAEMPCMLDKLWWLQERKLGVLAISRNRVDCVSYRRHRECKMMREGTLRKDLYFRISTIQSQNTAAA